MSEYPKILSNKCKCCNGDIIAKRSRDLIKEFCSTGCVGKFHHTKDKEYVECNYCKKEFLKTTKTKNLYCSHNCYSKSKIVEHKLNCLNCDKEFISHNIANIKRGHHKFCSVDCKDFYQRKYI
ncbi:MAG: hypothetical protein RLZZ546_2453, partial [Bacteroidota bacterium]